MDGKWTTLFKKGLLSDLISSLSHVILPEIPSIGLLAFRSWACPLAHLFVSNINQREAVPSYFSVVASKADPLYIFRHASPHNHRLFVKTCSKAFIEAQACKIVATVDSNVKTKIIIATQKVQYC